jgi:hypothetical protein
LELRGRKWREVREDSIMRNFIICTLRRVLTGEDEKGESRFTHGRYKNAYRNLFRNLKGRDHMEHPGVDGRMMLEWFLGMQGGKILTG